LSDKGYAVGKFLPIIDHPLPTKPVDIATNKDARQSYRRECAQVRNRIAAEFRKSCRTRMTMDTAERFIDKKEFYLPWSFDYRGRAYPIPAFLTPHDTDFGKSLIRFAYPTPLTESGEDWLAFQVATTYGKDKDTIKERLAWVKDNFTFISSVAQDPIGNLSLWEGVSEPWLFLAACDEYYHCCISRERSLTCLPVYVDATCSGLQILAGLARDASTARLVNVLPSSCPQDAYKAVADLARPNVPESIREHLDRKVVKKVVMTVPYNAKPFSPRHIRDA
jgi:DNA-directed RNA polymerase